MPFVAESYFANKNGRVDDRRGVKAASNSASAPVAWCDDHTGPKKGETVEVKFFNKNRQIPENFFTVVSGFPYVGKIKR